jgi:chaperonin cofactor prefoldin
MVLDNEQLEKRMEDLEKRVEALENASKKPRA